MEKDIERYFEALQYDCAGCYKIAERARVKGLDPAPHVEVASTERLSERVEKLLNIEGVAEVIDRHLNPGVSREEAALLTAKEIVNLHKDNPSLAADLAIRVGLAILTEGILVAPTGGIAEISIKGGTREGGYLTISYAGPIRSAGGTAQGMSVLIGDVARRELGLAPFRYSEQEIERFKEEIPLYKNLKNLQYLPSAEEIEVILRNLTICIDGEGTEDEEITGYRDLPRINTNRVRGGACLVVADGIAHKAAKLQALVNRLGIDGWGFLDELISLQRTKKTDNPDEETKGDKYLREIVMGRPVFSESNAPGGFRLRYGRSRSAGIAALSIHPATMVLTEFIAVGTQLKIEKPGKATSVTPCDTIDGPIVLLKNGDLVQITDVKDAERVKNDVVKIVDLGDILIPYGEFLENNHPLLPGAFCEEWWRLECREKGISPPERINAVDAVNLARKGPPLHPRYTYLWHDITPGEILDLRKFILEHGQIRGDTLILTRDEHIKDILVRLCVLHRSRSDIEIDDAYALIASLGLDAEDGHIKSTRHPPDPGTMSPMEFINTLAGFAIKPRAPTRIGTRMGRPEKAKERMLEDKKINILFPMGQTTRKLSDILHNGGKIIADVMVRRCRGCMRTGVDPICRECGAPCDPVKVMKNVEIKIPRMVESVVDHLGEDVRRYTEHVMGVHGLISGKKIPETLEKGFLRAKHEVYPFKDGTARVDMTDVPLTHFKVREIGIDVETARGLGYLKDIHGNDLERDDQILELYPQDVIPSRLCLEYFARVAAFIDELLVKVYHQPPFYNIKKPEDLIGHLVIGLAPHTSCGVVARIIGWTNARVCYAHPYFHAAKRRNCDGDEDSLILLLDALINFSREYLPEGRGGTMDSPLILTTRINPSEIDKEAHNMDILPEYPLEFYRMAEKGVSPKMVSAYMTTVSSMINKSDPYSGMMFTHDTSDISLAPTGSIYGTLEDADQLLDAQIRLTKKIRAVDENKVFTILIQHHLLRDMQGCLRTFHSQSFICSKCKQTTRRITLSGRCPECNAPLRLTMTKNSVTKYLEKTNRLSREFDLSPYVLQRIKMMETFFTTTFKEDTTKLDDY